MTNPLEGSSSPATPQQEFDIVTSVRDHLSALPILPFEGEHGGFETSIVALAEPRVIGERTAHFLRLLRQTTGGALTGVSYQTTDVIPHADTNVRQEIPFRDVTVYPEGGSKRVFNGSNIDARDYPLTEDVAAELLSDLASAHYPY